MLLNIYLFNCIVKHFINSTLYRVCYKWSRVKHTLVIISLWTMKKLHKDIYFKSWWVILLKEILTRINAMFFFYFFCLICCDKGIQIIFRFKPIVNILWSMIKNTPYCYLSILTANHKHFGKFWCHKRKCHDATCKSDCRTTSI